MAAVWKLPVVFCCENNKYGEYSAQHKTTPVSDLAIRAQAYNMPGLVVDGQDVETVYEATKGALAHARAGGGPTLLEFKTYRFRGHSRTDTGPYRPKGELEEWMQRDPIDILKRRMFADGQLDETEFDEMKQAAEMLVLDAIEFAKAEPYPPLDELLADIYYEK
jgi:TPP-dependent pyruvate/acetoin dehydrogenase alpha subunit